MLVMTTMMMKRMMMLVMVNSSMAILQVCMRMYVSAPVGELLGGCPTFRGTAQYGP